MRIIGTFDGRLNEKLSRPSSAAYGALVALLALSGLTSCGDDDGGGGCAVEACGGDVLGTWSVDSMCIDFTSNPFEEPECSNALAGTDVDASGTYAFSPDNTLAVVVSFSLTENFVINAACYQALGGEGSLSDTVCQVLQGELEASEAITSVACGFTGGTCHCTVGLEAQTVSATGTYQVSGNQLIRDDGPPLDYCVNGDTLTIESDVMDTAEGSLTLTRSQ